MTNFIPVMNVLSPMEVKINGTYTEPRAETVALIRHFARYYSVDCGKQQKVLKRLIN